MAVLAYLLPTVFSWMTPYIAYMLQFVMFAMGLTLTAQVFLDVFKQPIEGYPRICYPVLLDAFGRLLGSFGI